MNEIADFAGLVVTENEDGTYTVTDGGDGHTEHDTLTAAKMNVLHFAWEFINWLDTSIEEVRSDDRMQWLLEQMTEEREEFRRAIQWAQG